MITTKLWKLSWLYSPGLTTMCVDFSNLQILQLPEKSVQRRVHNIWHCRRHRITYLPKSEDDERWDITDVTSVGLSVMPAEVATRIVRCIGVTESPGRADSSKVSVVPIVDPVVFDQGTTLIWALDPPGSVTNNNWDVLVFYKWLCYIFPL